MLHRIAHSTDFSRESEQAFHHALRLALQARCRLDMLHVRDPDEPDAFDSFPHVREVLGRWSMLDQDAAPAEIETRLGVHVAKIEIRHRDPRSGIASFFHEHRPDLMVVATHGRRGVNRWLQGSVTEDLVKRTHVPALMIGPHSRGFVDANTGTLRLERILLPLAPQPNPAQALQAMLELLAPLGAGSERFKLMTVGDDVPDLMDPAGHRRPVAHFHGPVVDTILEQAADRGVDLIAMPTAGHHGFLEAYRGSTTSRVLAEAPCPVLTLPMIRP
jgi:nucleotide-binding universal stress UspA family protein